MKCNSILSTRQAGFRPGRFTLDLILYLSQSISDEFNKPKHRFLTILATIDFSEALESVWRPAYFHKYISAGLPPCFARRTQSFHFDRRACMLFQNNKITFSSVEVFRKDPFLAVYFSLSSSMIFLLLSAFFGQLFFLC